MTAAFIPSDELLALRERIDAHDQELAHMMCQRLELIIQAAPLKPRFEDVRLEDRIEEIIEKITPIADQYGIDRAYLETLYRLMMDESIAREAKRWQQINDAR
ncbi:chorismate mutase [Suttonella sp. R2A3]|uniref:chorismate mutase n=1 Tax=Suttonella sp. R2A3 TaxID=2908648 RepID=UPI001F490CE1|nr:chorismate mutase [Suttonella sp. R2A3]UJF24447.1 chorismate mutase [Suttonella sp. R2A3]